MAVGDLCTAYGVYELNGLAFGHGTDIWVTKAERLLGKSDVKTTDVERQAAWGEFPGRDMYKGRQIIFTLDVVNDINPIETNMANLEAAWAIPDVSPPAPQYQLVFWRNWPVAGKRFYWVRPGRMGVVSDSAYAYGYTQVLAELKAADPRSYSLTDYTDTYTILNTTNQISGNTVNNGDSASAPILTIQGPCTNPVITNSTDANKAFKLTMVLLSTDTVVIDFRQRTILKNGIDSYARMALDSVWWKLRPGSNSIVYSRQDSGAPSTMTLVHKDVWS